MEVIKWGESSVPGGAEEAGNEEGRGDSVY